MFSPPSEASVADSLAVNNKKNEIHIMVHAKAQYCLGQDVTLLIENWDVNAETIPDSFNTLSCGSLRQKTQVHLVALYPGT